MRIAILSNQNNPLCYMDNDLADALHYFDDCLHTYLAGSQYTYEFKTFTDHPDSDHLAVGNHLAFRDPKWNKDYYLTIMSVERSSTLISITAYGLSLELTNEDKQPEKFQNITFEQRFNGATPDLGEFRIGVNEIAGQKRSWEFTGTDSFLKRIFSIANEFDAEIGFECHLNDDYSLNEYLINVYKKHDDTHQGLGTNRTGQVIRYGSGLSGIEKTEDITDLYTSIKPIGKNGLTLSGRSDKIYDSEGKLLFECDGLAIHGVQARDRFPSTLKESADRYTQKFLGVDTDSKDVLMSTGLRELKKVCDPKLSYKVDGYIDAEIGDTVTLEDSSYKPALYVQCRVVEQEVSFTDPTRSKTTFDNFSEVTPQLSSEITTIVQQLIEKTKVYIGQIVSTNGVQFANGTGSTVLTAMVMDGATDIADDLVIKWYRDGTEVGTGKTLTVQAATITKTALYGFKAFDKGVVRSQCQVTVVNVEDGQDGSPGKDGKGISNQSITYGLSASESTQPSSWSNAVPTLVKGQYLWTKMVLTYTDNTTSTSYQKTYIPKDGTNGDDGIPGKDGTGIKNSVVSYAVSTSGSSAPTYGWQTAFPTVATGQYLWTRTIFTYTDNTSETVYTVSRVGKDGSTGPQGNPGKDGSDAPAGIVLTVQSSNGDTFKNSDFNTNLKASVTKGNKELTSSEILALGAVVWYEMVNGSPKKVGTGITLSVTNTTSPTRTFYAQLEG